MLDKAVKINPELFDNVKHDENTVKESADILKEAEEIKAGRKRCLTEAEVKKKYGFK